MNLEKKLAKLRKEAGMSQAELAEKLEVSRQAVSRWESGDSKPSIENLRALCNLHNIQLDLLLDESKETSLNRAVLKETVEDHQEKKERKKYLQWIMILALALACGMAIAVSIFKEDAKEHNLEDIPGEVMPATGSDFTFEW